MFCNDVVNGILLFFTLGIAFADIFVVFLNVRGRFSYKKNCKSCTKKSKNVMFCMTRLLSQKCFYKNYKFETVVGQPTE